jgi:hypothetical protein
MKSDINVPASHGVEVVITPRAGETHGELWDVFLVNTTDQVLKNVLISSRGYGEINGRDKTTATLRHFFEEIGAQKAIMVEPIQSAVFEITNEYWLSYNTKGNMLEKKFIFQPNTITSDALVTVAVLDQKGIVA